MADIRPQVKWAVNLVTAYGPVPNADLLCKSDEVLMIGVHVGCLYVHHE